MAKCGLFILLIFLASCDAHYTMNIEMRDAAGVRHPDINEVFTAPDDTSAFKLAVERLGLYRFLQRKRNVLHNQNQPEPYAFSLKNEDSTLIRFSPEETQRLVGARARYWQLKLKQANLSPAPENNERELIRVR